MHLNDFIQKGLKNILVQYQGGVRDTEPKAFFKGFTWNFFYFDKNGQFHSILSTGQEGISDEKIAKELCAAFKDNPLPSKIFAGENYYYPTQVYFYDLDSEEDKIEIFSECDTSDITLLKKWFKRNDPKTLKSDKDMAEAVRMRKQQNINNMQSYMSEYYDKGKK